MASRFADAGAAGKEDLPSFYPNNVLTVLDEGHPLYGKVSTTRYEPSAPENASLVDSIYEMGVLQPGSAWFIRDSGKAPFVIYGTRRTLALIEVNRRRALQGEPPLKMAFRLTTRSKLTRADLAEILSQWAAENNERIGNDWLTVAQGAALQLTMGVDPEFVLQRWPQIESRKMLNRLVASDGILTAHPDVKEALASRTLTLGKAMQLAKLPYADQARALHAPPAAREKRRYMTARDREDLRILIGELPDGGCTLTPDLVATLKRFAAEL